ncbi:uncharacterized protein LOC132033011 [Lycium ferocissimum]|uniref:uncharacterized protein LOC132033011 n=1 Tax=Lycium ferocissimum TaxID=112874 RepID=UPI0028162C31|nr:uncharacterized protein LOC132033011 [Lycium ferocissimum]
MLHYFLSRFSPCRYAENQTVPPCVLTAKREKCIVKRNRSTSSCQERDTDLVHRRGSLVPRLFAGLQARKKDLSAVVLMLYRPILKSVMKYAVFGFHSGHSLLVRKSHLIST